MSIRHLIFLIGIVFTSAGSAQRLVLQTGHHSPVQHMSFFDDGKMLATADDRGVVNIWDMNTRLQQRSYHEQHVRILDLLVLPNGMIYSLGADSTLAEYQANNHHVNVKRLKERYNCLINIGDRLFAGGESLIVYDTDEPRVLDIGLNGEVIIDMARIDQFHLAIQTDNHRLKILDLRVTGFVADERSKTDQLIIEGNKIFAISENYVRCFEWSGTALKPRWFNHHPSSNFADILNGVVTKDHLVLSSTGMMILFYDKETGDVDYTINERYGNITSIGYSMTTDIMAHATGDNEITLWDSDEFRVFYRIRSSIVPITDIAYDEGQNALLIIQQNGSAKVWRFNNTLDPIKHRFMNLERSSVSLTYPHFDHIKRFDEDEAVYLSYRLLKNNLMDLSWKLSRNYEVTWDLKKDRMYVRDEPWMDEFKRIKEVRDVTLLFSMNDTFSFQTDVSEAYMEDGILFLEYRGISNSITLEAPEFITDVICAGELPYAFTSSSKGVVTCYDMQTGERLMRLMSPGTNEFIMINEENDYFASKGALGSIAFEHEGTILPYEQFDATYNRPGKVLDQWPFFNDSAVVEAFESAYQKRIEKLVDGDMDFTIDLPEIDISAAKYSTEEEFVEISIESSSKHPLTEIFIKVNGVPYHKTDFTQLSGKTFEWKGDIPLSAGINNIEVVAVDVRGKRSLEQSLQVNRNVNRVHSELYIVTIGAGSYEAEEFNLNYAEKDANDVERTFKKNKHFKGVNRLNLRGEEVRKDQLGSIRSFVEKAGIDDVVIIFYAGHGLLDEDYNYYLATYSTDFEKPAGSAIPYADLEEIMNNIMSRQKLILLDACHSGEVDETELTASSEENTIEYEEDIVFRSVGTKVSGQAALGSRTSFELSKQVFADLRESSGTVVISSASGSEVAIEGDKWKNGIFTYSMIRGLKQRKADANFDGEVSVLELQGYVQSEVERITQGRQQPTSRKENLQNNFRVW